MRRGAGRHNAQAPPRSAAMKPFCRPTLLALSFVACCVPRVLAAEARDKVLTYPAGTDTPVSLTLLARHDKVGRDNPFYDKYRPQLRFSAGRHEITCTVRIAQPRDQVAPGETAEVAINCPEPFQVFERNKSFTVHEGGRKVAEGTLR